jgi:hypothetical protein
MKGVRVALAAPADKGNRVGGVDEDDDLGGAACLFAASGADEADGDVLV